jgi:hypothetical protein
MSPGGEKLTLRRSLVSHLRPPKGLQVRSSYNERDRQREERERRVTDLGNARATFCVLMFAAEAVYFGSGGKAGLVSVPRSSASAACSALSSFACLGM